MCQQAEAVLEVFLKQRTVDSKAILQADKKLAEKEKKIKGKSSPFLNSDQGPDSRNILKKKFLLNCHFLLIF